MANEICPKCGTIKELDVIVNEAEETDSDGNILKIKTNNFYCSSCHVFVKSENIKSNINKIFVFIYDGMADFEMTLIAHILGTDLGKEIVTIAYENHIIRSVSGLEYKPKRLVKDSVKDNVDGLIIPGGWNGELRLELIELIKNVNSQGKLLGAICGGPYFLAKSNILQNRKYTTSMIEWTEMHKQQYEEIDPFPRENFVNKRVVVDENLITSQGVAFIDFACEICDWFKLFKNGDEKNQFLKTLKG
ncbi:thiJ/pfpI family protein [Desulfosporosinus sp. I2]|uniref:DJ-1/PfpI family protein n=1 Tax=Desulfosporosinus sp. I2 TaxID=1617025 RepID=UPI00061FD3D6|nr:thiJ/pfpI family protein [Desulfosporosinus sp. I2]